MEEMQKQLRVGHALWDEDEEATPEEDAGGAGRRDGAEAERQEGEQEQQREGEVMVQSLLTRTQRLQQRLSVQVRARRQSARIWRGFAQGRELDRGETGDEGARGKHDAGPTASEGGREQAK